MNCFHSNERDGVKWTCLWITANLNNCISTKHNCVLNHAENSRKSSCKYDLMKKQIEFGKLTARIQIFFNYCTKLFRNKASVPTSHFNNEKIVDSFIFGWFRVTNAFHIGKRLRVWDMTHATRSFRWDTSKELTSYPSYQNQKD